MGNSKKILMLLQSDFPPDIRLSKEIKTLAKNNHKIYLLCNNKTGYPEEEIVDGARVIRLKYYNFLSKKLQISKNIPLFFNPVWISKIIKLIKRYQIDVIHVHDLPLAPTAIIIGKMFHISVIYDMHENYPEALRIWRKKNPLNLLFKNPKLAEILDKFCISKVSKIIVTAEEHREYLMRHNRVRPDKIYVISNTVDFQEYLSYPFDHDIIRRYREDFVLTYLGKLSVERDLDVAIKSIKHVAKKIKNVKLLFIGDGDVRDRLFKLATTEGVLDRVEFTGWVDFEKTPSYLETSNICIIPQSSNPLIDNGVPHKLFQYMAMGKPVVVSDAKAMARIVRECRCGEVFRSGSPEDFADAVIKIWQSNTNYGENGRRAVMEKYNWENSSKELLRLYQTLNKC